MAQMERIESQQFWTSGFVVQINDDQFYVAQGPFEAVTLQKNDFKHCLGLNCLLIKPAYWDFLNSEIVEALKPKASRFMTKKEFQELANQESQKLELEFINLKWSLDFKSDFTEQFEDMQDLISQGLLEKAVPIGVSRAELESKLRPQNLLQNLLKDSTARGWIYGFWTNDSGFVGRTPELLFQSFPIEDKKISTMALAGTWPKNSVQKNDYQDPKIWNEHQIVVKDIKSQLSGLECVFESKTEVIELKNLAHLKTQLEFRYNDLEQILDVVQKLHPTAALGIYPRKLDMYKKIHAMPLQANRGCFGAPFGVIGEDISHLVVGIRGVTWNNRTLQLFAGCGITKDSQLESEYQEILFKMDAVRKMLGLSLL